MFTCLTLTLTLALPPTDPTWEKVVLDRKFRGEGVAVADANKDGKMDVLAGEWWYEAPNWSPHEMQKPGDYGTGERGYSRVFACWAEDLNADGYPDLIVVDFPGDPCYWLENPKGDPGKHWKRHVIWHSACNETPVYADLFGTGKRVLIMGFQPKGSDPNGNNGQMAYFTPKADDPAALWDMHPISEPSKPGQPVPGTFKFSHGLGVGDINGDGKADVMTSGATTNGMAGWWEQPKQADGKTAWAFHPFNFGDAVADMHAYDLDADGKADILCTSAHRFGVWMLKQRTPSAPKAKAKDAKPADAPIHPAFDAITLFGRLSSETHASVLIDMNGDGLPDLVTGKRWWSHGRSEPGHAWDARVYWLKAVKEKDGAINLEPKVIDSDSGVGTQFAVADVDGDGLLDVVSSNKKGVRVIYQRRGAAK